MTERHRSRRGFTLMELSYVYATEGEHSAAKFTASAHGDLDCDDGLLSTFETQGFGDDGGTRRECAMKGAASYFEWDETE